jgi:hypothetical protein
MAENFERCPHAGGRNRLTTIRQLGIVPGIGQVTVAPFDPKRPGLGATESPHSIAVAARTSVGTNFKLPHAISRADGHLPYFLPGTLKPFFSKALPYPLRGPPPLASTWHFAHGKPVWAANSGLAVAGLRTTKIAAPIIKTADARPTVPQ